MTPFWTARAPLSKSARAVVTGAGSGIGRAVALGLRARSFSLGQLRLRLGKRRLVRLLIAHEQDLSSLDVLALNSDLALQHTPDARPDLHRIGRFDLRGILLGDRNAVGLELQHADGHACRRRRRFGAATSQDRESRRDP